MFYLLEVVGKIKNNEKYNISVSGNMARKQIARKVVKKSRSMRAPATFGPVTAINTAPVSVGNSVRGSAPRVTTTTDGARIVGRDFAFALASTPATVTGWELIGGMPLTPACLPSSVLRNYCQMFNKFKVNRFVVHYITSSPTSQAGDVLFYYEKDRYAPMVDYSNSSFLPYVLSDPHTVIGPQWTNHSVILAPTKDWKTTLFGMGSDMNEDSEGTLFFFSKTNAANSPGYLLIDYDLQFKELSVNPRAGSLPIARAQSSFIGLTLPATTTAGNAITWSTNTANSISNTASVMPNGTSAGDIYKVIFQITASTIVNSAWSATTGGPPTVSNVLQYADDTAITLDDGFTCYGRVGGSNTMLLYNNLESAVTDSGRLEAQTSFTVANVKICAEIQYVRSVSSGLQSSY